MRVGGTRSALSKEVEGQQARGVVTTGTPFTCKLLGETGSAGMVAHRVKPAELSQLLGLRAQWMFAAQKAQLGAPALAALTATWVQCAPSGCSALPAGVGQNQGAK